MTQDERFMEEALQLAEEAARLGEVFRDALGITPTAYRKREKE